MNFKMISKLRLGFWVGLSLMGWLFVSCNTEPEVEHRIDLFLNDSLSFDNGNYDSLQISIVSTTGAVIQPLVFHGKYKSDSTGGVLKGLLLGSTVPAEFDIAIKAFHKNGDTVSVKITVKDKEAGAVVRIDTIKTGPVVPPVGPGDSDTVANTNSPTGITLSDSVLTLGVSSEPRQIFAVLRPAGASGLVQFKTTDSTIATVSDNGLVDPVAVGEAMVIASIISHPHLADTVRVRVIIPPAITQVTFARPAPLLYVGAPGIKLNVAHLPDNLTPLLEFKSSDPGAIEVNAIGEVRALAVGTAIITVTASGSNGVTDTLHIRAMRDAPFIDAGPTQSVAVGQPVSIKVKVTQAFGTLTLSWDWNGDGLSEGQTTQDTVTVTHAFNAQGDSGITFTAKDGEGNTTTQTVRVRVGKAGPLIIITKPKQDTLVNTPKFTVQYTSDGAPKSQEFNLLEGSNNLTVKDSNATGTDSAWVKVRLDTKAPVVKITAPADRSITNLPEIDVAWTVDSVARGTQLKESLVGKEGLITIARAFTDSAGNYGRDTIVITRDTVPPAAPVFAGGDTTMNSKIPTWSWTSGGGGNGTFAVQLGAGTAQELTTTTFTPAAPLNDGIYTLTIRERDAAGNWSAWRSKTITIKTTGPGAPTFSSLTTTSPTNDKTPTWAWTSSGVIGGGSGYFRWSVNTTPPVSDSGITTSYTPTANLNDGTYTLTLQERDGVGNWSPAVDSTIRILTQGVLVVITSPARNSYTNVKSGVVTVTWEVAQVAQTPNTHTLINEGAWNQIRREFRDAAGNVSFDTLSVFWDTTAPRVAISSPNPGIFVNSLIVPVSWSVDDVSQLTRVADTLTGPDGVKTISRAVTDRAGNPGSASVTVRLDQTPPDVPTVNVSPSSPTNDNSPTWSWSTTGQFEYRYGTANPPTTNTTATSATSFTPTTGLANGTWHFQVRARDSAMNWSGWSIVNSVVIDTIPPNAPTVTPGQTPTNGNAVWTWNTGSDNTGGSGLRSPASYRYSINAGVTWTTTSATICSVTTAGTHDLVVQVQDRANNWSATSSPSRIVVDRSATGRPSFTVLPSSPRNTTSTSTSLTWTWSSTGAIAYEYLLSQSQTPPVSGTAISTNTYIRTGALTQEGNWYFHVRARNAAGTWSEWETANLFVDNTNPNAPAVTPGKTPTNGNAVWTWSTGADNTGGSGLKSPASYRYSLNSGSTWATTSATICSVTTTGTHTLVVQVQDRADNWSNSSTQSVIVVDRSIPAAPTLTNTPSSPRNAGTSSSTQTWTWGGTGTFQYLLNQSSATPTGEGNALPLNANSYTRTGTLAEGNWYFHLRVQNAAGTWSPWRTTAAMVIDNTAPVVTITNPANNFVTNQSQITVRFTDGLVTKDTVCNLQNTDGSNICVARMADAAGNTGESTRTIWRRGHVYFVTPTGAGNLSGSDWGNAMSGVRFESAFLDLSDAETKEFWLGNGSYSNFPRNTSKFTIRGGFNSLSLPYNTDNRDRNATRIGLSQASVGEQKGPGKFILDGVYLFDNIAAPNSSWELIDVTIATSYSDMQGGLVFLSGGSIDADNLNIIGRNYFDAAIFIEGGNLVLNGGLIQNNTAPYGAIYASQTTTVRLNSPASILNNISDVGKQVWLTGDSQLIIGAGVSLQCSDVFINSGAAICQKN